ncbi:MAG: DUF2141 domain-containing protein [Cytophagaceae bacterium]
MKRFVLCTLVSVFICSAMPPKNSGTMEIEITGIDNDKGSIKLAMFNSESGYPRDGKQAFRTHKAGIKDKKVLIVFHDVPYGKYAIAFLHDENDNDKMDFHFYGAPKEQYGASNDAQGIMGPPSFEDAAFDFNKNNTRIVMKARN